MGLKEIENNLKKVITDIQSKALKVIEIEGEKSIQKNFEASGRPSPWKQRKRLNAKQKKTKILVITGALKNVRAVTEGNKVIFYPDPRARAYARIHQEGGTINMPSRKVAMRKTKSGKKVFAGSRHKKTEIKTTKPYTVTIPARPYLLIPESDFDRIRNAVRMVIK